jgi:hypothetical protein
VRLNGDRASALRRQAAAVAAVAGPAIDGYEQSTSPVDGYARQHDLAARLRAAAARLAPGWLGAPLDAVPPTAPVGGNVPPCYVRVGQAHPLDDARFPVVVPLLATGHLAVDADARDARVAGLLRSLLLRLLATAPTGSLRVRTVDSGDTFAPFEGIGTAGDPEGLRAVLDEAEAWVREPPRDGTTLLVLVAALPELTEPPDLTRLAALAAVGPAARLHLVVAGWPPPPLTPESTQAPLAACTQISVRNPYAWVGDPPDGAFAAGPRRVGGRLNAPVYLDPDPPAELIRRVCRQSVGGHPGTHAVDAGAWHEYLAAAQGLDTVRREVADGATGRQTAVVAVRDELAALRHRLAQIGAPAPTPAELDAARRAVAGPTGVSGALAHARAALDAAEAGSAADARATLIYGASALAVVVAEIAAFVVLGLVADQPAPAIAGILLLPPVGFGLGWLATEVTGSSPALGPGLVISALTMLPALVLVTLLALR